MAATRLKYSYAASPRTPSGYFGIVYHWNDHGTLQIIDHKTPARDKDVDAMDAAGEWAEDHELDAEADFQCFS